METEKLHGIDNFETDSNTEGTNDSVQDGAQSGEILTPEKVNEIIRKKTGKYIAKNAELKNQVESLSKKSEALNEFMSALSPLSGINDDTEAQIKFVQDYISGMGLELPKKTSKPEHNSDDVETKAYVAAQRFVSKSSDDDFCDEVEELLEKRKKNPSKFTAADTVKLEQYQERYAAIRFGEDKTVAAKWYGEKGGKLEDLLVNSEFIEFVQDLQIPISKAVKQWVKLKGAPQKTSEAVSSGSAKDTGGSTAKEYFTREEVSKMSREEIRKNLDVIEKSRSKW